MQIQSIGAVRTMSSIELLELVNQARAEFGESEVRRNDFTARCRDELEGEHYETFVVQNPNGTESDALQMSRDQCLYVLMRESKAVRRAVTVKLNRAAAPAELSRMDILRLALESEEARLKAEAERDAAIRTKALIGSKREATAMATASAARREASKLRDALGKLAKDFHRFDERMAALARHIDQASRDVQDVQTSSRKISAHFQKIESARLDELDESGPLGQTGKIELEPDVAGPAQT